MNISTNVGGGPPTGSQNTATDFSTAGEGFHGQRNPMSMRGFSVPGTGNGTSNGLVGGMAPSTGVRLSLLVYRDFISLAFVLVLLPHDIVLLILLYLSLFPPSSLLLSKLYPRAGGFDVSDLTRQYRSNEHPNQLDQQATDLEGSSPTQAFRTSLNALVLSQELSTLINAILETMRTGNNLLEVAAPWHLLQTQETPCIASRALANVQAAHRRSRGC